MPLQNKTFTWKYLFTDNQFQVQFNLRCYKYAAADDGEKAKRQITMESRITVAALRDNISSPTLGVIRGSINDGDLNAILKLV